MTRTELVNQIRKKKSFLCVGLDTDLQKIPKHLLSFPDPVFEFNRQVIDATKAHCIAYKINTAFYEAMGLAGWESMQKTLNHIPASHFTIADAKRGDIGNTSAQYARAFFETLNFDSITVSPYMGVDSLRPFLEYEKKWTIVLALTSNPGASDFEMQLSGEVPLYERVIEIISQWGTTENLMFVIGATRPETFKRIRELAPTHFYLVPGVGAQSGDLHQIAQNAIIPDIGLIVNVSRSIIYSSSSEDFAEKAGAVAAAYQNQMQGLF